MYVHITLRDNVQAHMYVHFVPREKKPEKAGRACQRIRKKEGGSKYPEVKERTRYIDGANSGGLLDLGRLAALSVYHGCPTLL